MKPFSDSLYLSTLTISTLLVFLLCVFVCLCMLISRDVIIQLRWGLHQKMQNFSAVCNVKNPIDFGPRNGHFYPKMWFPLYKVRKERNSTWHGESKQKGKEGRKDSVSHRIWQESRHVPMEEWIWSLTFNDARWCEQCSSSATSKMIWNYFCKNYNTSKYYYSNIL